MLGVYATIIAIVFLFIVAPLIVYAVEQKLGIKNEPETDEE
jgi:hypothetical protein